MVITLTTIFQKMTDITDKSISSEVIKNKKHWKINQKSRSYEELLMDEVFEFEKEENFESAIGLLKEIINRNAVFLCLRTTSVLHLSFSE